MVINAVIWVDVLEEGRNAFSSCSHRSRSRATTAVPASTRLGQVHVHVPYLAVLQLQELATATYIHRRARRRSPQTVALQLG